MCKNYNNIEFKGPVSEQELYELYGKCKATLYLSYKEDFGIIPIESMAAGKPCIATNEGGFKETIIHKKTGYLVNNPEDINQVINAVDWIDKNATKLKKYCESRSRLFSKKMHFKKLGRELS
jgi:glycosyltransferase involved in cell wall biosynthesis